MDSIFTVIILGSLWGIFEATIGHVLHMLALPLGSFVWFPIAFYFINRTYKSTKSYNYVIVTALIASSFKLLDLFFPVRIDMVINPSISMILEAIAFILVFHYADIKKPNFLHILLLGFTWRTFYLCYVLLMPESIMMISPAADMLKFTKFMFLYNVGNCVLIYVCCLVSEKVTIPNALYVNNSQFFNKYAFLKPAFSAFSLIAAIVVQFMAR